MAHRFAGRSYGKLHRAKGSTPARPLDPPKCCDTATLNLMHEQAVAATQLSPVERVKWIAKGGHYLHRGGKRPWRATMRPQS
jgi:hypothetical protein